MKNSDGLQITDINSLGEHVSLSSRQYQGCGEVGVGMNFLKWCTDFPGEPPGSAPQHAEKPAKAGGIS